jgi:diguanylate cyclase (GGDEF)-like protein
MNRRDLLRSLPLLAAPGVAHAAPDVLLTPDEQAWLARHPVVLYAPERDFPPFSFVDGQGQHRGLSADLLDLLHQHTGLKFQPVAAQNRNENLERVKRHEIDLVTSLRPTEERSQYLSFTGAYVSSPAVVLRRRDDRRGGDAASLAGERVGVDRGSATSQFLAETAPDAIQVPYDMAAEALRALAFGETDAVVLNLATATYLITRERIIGLRVAGELPYFSTLTIGYRKDWPLLGRVLERGLAQITEAERNALISRWIPLSDLAWWQRSEVQRVLGVSAIATGLLMGGMLLWNRTLRRAVASQTEALRKELAERHRLEQRLRTLAEHDPLTGLMNRAALTEALRRSLALAARQKWSVAVVFIDLDGFKQVNDSMGHAAGDELLRQIASRLSNCLRESDLLGRLGGDEFIVVAEALHEGARNAFEFTDKLLMQMRRPFTVDGQSVSVGFSAGIAIYPGDGDTPEALIANADVAMYRAKAEGRFRAALYRRDDEPAGGAAGEGGKANGAAADAAPAETVPAAGADGARTAGES